MSDRCQLGDIAIIIKDQRGCDANIGRVVHVCGPRKVCRKRGTLWRIKPVVGSTITYIDYDGSVKVGLAIDIEHEDDWLMPIRPDQEPEHIAQEVAELFSASFGDCMTVIEMNIRLDAGGLRETPMVIDRRQSKVLERLAPYGEVRHRREDYGHLRNLILEVCGEVPNRIIHRLARDLKQDCIAVYKPQNDTGTLIGPRADLWVRFRKFCFRRFDPTLSESRKMTQEEAIEYWACSEASLHLRLALRGHPVTIIESDDKTYVATIPQGRKPYVSSM